MPVKWPSDDELEEKARSGQEAYQVAAVEAMRRLRASIDALRRSTDTYSKWLIGLTMALALLTAVLAYKALRP